MRRVPVLVLGAVLTVLTLLLIAGHGPWAGHVIWALDSEHGLNSGDVPVLAMWVAGCVCCVLLYADGRRR